MCVAASNRRGGTGPTRLRERLAAMKSQIAFASICIWLCSCKADQPPTIWKNDLLSPNGKWTAIAYTVQNGGFGSASIETVVELKSMDGTVNSAKPHDVLSFTCYGPAARPYTLSDENRGGSIHLDLRWTDATHLKATYDGRADINLQVVRLADVNISLAIVPRTPVGFNR